MIRFVHVAVVLLAMTLLGCQTAEPDVAAPVSTDPAVAAPQPAAAESEESISDLLATPIPMELSLNDRNVQLTIISGDTTITALPRDGSPIVLPAEPFHIAITGDIDNSSFIATRQADLLTPLRDCDAPIVIMQGTKYAAQDGCIGLLTESAMDPDAPTMCFLDEFCVVFFGDAELSGAMIDLLVDDLGELPFAIAVGQANVDWQMTSGTSGQYTLDSARDHMTKTDTPIQDTGQLTLVWLLEDDMVEGTYFSPAVWMEIPIEFE